MVCARKDLVLCFPGSNKGNCSAFKRAKWASQRWKRTSHVAWKDVVKICGSIVRWHKYTIARCLHYIDLKNTHKYILQFPLFIGEAINGSIHPSDQLWGHDGRYIWQQRSSRSTTGLGQGAQGYGNSKEVECNHCSLTPPTAFGWRKIKVVSLPHKSARV